MKLDAIIVLGAGMTKNETLPNLAITRLDKAIQFYKNNPAKFIILSGKYSYKLKKKPSMTEAKLMREYIIEKGIKSNIVLTEEYSKDTFGNAYFTRQFITDPKKLKNLAIVTNDFHILKSTYLFRKVFGKGYILHFVVAKSGFSQEKLKKLEFREKLVLTLLKTYLKKIKSGDMSKLRKFLYNNHPVYKVRAGILFEMLVKVIRYLERR